MNLKKKSNLILFIGILLLPFISFLIIPSNFTTSITQFNIGDNSKSSGYWNLEPIHIDGIATGVGAHNWTWAETQPWCTGEGTLLNPYLLENITIDCEGVGNGIFIENSFNEYFIIQNCSIKGAQASGGYAGIKLSWVQNGTIFNNNCSNNYAGMYIGHCEKVNISENLIFDNVGQGIILYQSKYNYISNNVQKGSRYYGLFIQGLSHNNTITGNIFKENTHATYNGDGIFISNSNGNNVTGNSLEDNDRGIHVAHNSNENIIADNIIHDNAEYGILILRETQECADNIIFGNNLVNPLGINAYDNGTNTQWDYLSQGNYWSDYSGVDLNDDGIGDSPYNITGTGLGQDNFPIWDDGLETSPPPAIPFGNYYILFMGIGIMCLLIIVLKKRKLIPT